MKILEKKISEKKEDMDVPCIVLVTDDSTRKFNVARVPVNLDLSKGHYFFPMMVKEERAREKYNNY